VARGELLLDPILAGQQPVHRRVQIVLARVGHAEVLGQRGGVPPARGRQLRMWRDDARGHHRQHQLAFAAGPGGEQRCELQTLQAQRNALNVAVRTRCRDLEGLRCRLQCLAAQRRANGLDLRRRQARQIRQRALADLGALSVGLTQQHRGGRTAIRHDENMHAYIILLIRSDVNL
jgi:hypothetical protein